MIKKLSSKKDSEKKHKRNQWILGIILVFIMFGSVFGIIAGSFNNSSSKTDSIKYNGYDFIPEGNYFTLTLNQLKFYFITNPFILDSLNKSVNLSLSISTYSGKPLYLDSIDSQSSSEIYQNLANYVPRVQPACEDELNCPDETYPIKDCTNNLIIIKESENNRIYQKQNCAYIEGKKEDLLKLTDEFLLNIIGVK